MRNAWLLLVSLAACAPSSARFEARIANLERQVAELRERAAQPVRVEVAPELACGDASVPAGTTLDDAVAFTPGETTLRPGDRIVVREIRGDHPAFVEGGSYVARGEYELSSADEAILGFTVRGGCTTGNARGRLAIKRGKGTFELATRVAYVGEPHISIFRASHGAITNADELDTVMLGHAGPAKPSMLNRVLGGGHP